MADTVKIPGIGPLDKKYAYVGGAAVAGFVGYAYWRNRQASAAAATTATDTTATDTTALDAANAAASDPSYAYGTGDGGYAYGGGYPIYQSPINGNYPTPTGGAPSTDPQWTQEAINWLANIGVDSQAASHAIALFMSDMCMTSQEADYVRQAKAGLGDPPQTHHNIQICSTNNPPPTGGGGPIPAPANFHVTGTSKTGVTLSWSAVPGKNVVYLLHGDGGGISHSIGTFKTSFTYGQLKPGTKYNFHVQAVSDGVNGAASPTVSATTKKK